MVWVRRSSQGERTSFDQTSRFSAERSVGISGGGTSNDSSASVQPNRIRSDIDSRVMSGSGKHSMLGAESTLPGLSGPDRATTDPPQPAKPAQTPTTTTTNDDRATFRTNEG